MNAHRDLPAQALERRSGSRREQDQTLIHQQDELDATRQQFAALKAIYDLTSTLNQSNCLDKLCQAALTALCCGVKADRASILLFDSAGVMRFKAWHQLSEDYRKAVEGHSPWTPAETNPKPILIAEIEEEAALDALRAPILREGIRSLGFFPLVSRAHLLGKFMIYYDRPHEFTEDEIQVSQTIANHIAFALERKQTEDELRTTLERLEQSKMALEEKVSDLEKFEDVVIGRELKMIALERELANLKGGSKSILPE